MLGGVPWRLAMGTSPSVNEDQSLTDKRYKNHIHGIEGFWSVARPSSSDPS